MKMKLYFKNKFGVVALIVVLSTFTLFILNIDKSDINCHLNITSADTIRDPTLHLSRPYKLTISNQEKEDKIHYYSSIIRLNGGVNKFHCSNISRLHILLKIMKDFII